MHVLLKYSKLSAIVFQAENCSDAEVIYRFLEANKIGQSHASYYIAYALLMEAKHKIKTANDIFNHGLSM